MKLKVWDEVTQSWFYYDYVEELQRFRNPFVYSGQCNPCGGENVGHIQADEVMPDDKKEPSPADYETVSRNLHRLFVRIGPFKDKDQHFERQFKVVAFPRPSGIFYFVGFEVAYLLTDDGKTLERL